MRLFKPKEPENLHEAWEKAWDENKKQQQRDIELYGYTARDELGSSWDDPKGPDEKSLRHRLRKLRRAIKRAFRGEPGVPGPKGEKGDRGRDGICTEEEVRRIVREEVGTLFFVSRGEGDGLR